MISFSRCIFLDFNFVSIALALVFPTDLDNGR